MADEFIKISYFSPTKIARQNIVMAMCYAAQKYARGNLIDVGCGTKPYESLFAPVVDSYLGVDYPQTMETNYGAQTKADIFTDCSETGLRDCSFDTLLSTQVIEHIYDTRKFINECYRILAPGGIGIFTIPFVWQCHSEPYDFYRFTRHSIQRLFSESGFKVHKIENLEGAYATLIQARIVYLLGREHNNLCIKIICRLKNLLLVPYLNFKALHLDRLFYSDKLCLTYLLIVKKV